MGAAVDPDLRTTLGAAPLVRDVVVVEGPEALAFLQGQLSQDLDDLVPGASRPALLLQPTGKAVAWLRATRTADDAVLLDVDAGAGEAVRARIRRFLLRTKATVDAATWTGVAVRGPGAHAAAQAAAAGADLLALPTAWPGVEAWDLVGPDGVVVDLPPASADALEALRIECGVPANGAEVTEDTIPAELGQWLVDASVSFTKGCYTGQELVARVDSRGGNVPRPLRGLLVEGPSSPSAGAAVVVDAEPVGAVTSAAVSPALGAVALAVLPRSIAPDAVVEVHDGEDRRSATVAELPLR